MSLPRFDLVDKHDWVDELPEGFAEGDACPKCGSTDTVCGFGLAGGGFGRYATCDGCGWMGKAAEEAEQP